MGTSVAPSIHVQTGNNALLKLVCADYPLLDVGTHARCLTALCGFLQLLHRGKQWLGHRHTVLVTLTSARSDLGFAGVCLGRG